MLLLGVVVLGVFGRPAALGAQSGGAGGGDSLRAAVSQLVVTVRDGRGPLAGARVAVEGAGGAEGITDAAGLVRLRLPAGRHSVTVRALGRAPARRVVTVADAGTVTLRIALDAAARVDPVVTTATLRDSYASEAPVRVEVVTPRLLERVPESSVLQSLRAVNGLQVQVDCGVCFTSNIRMNGMEGPYTAVLLDGAPVLGALAAVYALDGIDPALVEQVEIVKGPSSTLYGSEAMAGVINVITKDPRFAPRLSMHASATSDGETALDLAGAPTLGDGRLLLSASLGRSDRFVDRNDDGFADLPLRERATVFAKWGSGAAGGRSLDVTARGWYEARAGGVRDWTWDDRGSDAVYGEGILTRRGELVAAWQDPLDGRPLRLEGALTHHDQDSWYGTQPFMGRQTTAFAQATWTPLARGRHDLLVGATVRWTHYADSAVAQRTRETRLVPGVFAQDEVELTRRLTMLGGLRLDHHAAHGVIPSPRVAVRWTPELRTTVRAALATGFRVVNLFTEDHAALTGARRVVVADELRPERSVSLQLTVDRLFDAFGAADALSTSLDVFHTRFTDRILADFDGDPDEIRYANLDGAVVSRGVALGASFAAPAHPLTLTAGVTLQDVTRRGADGSARVPFAPRALGTWTAGWRFANGVGVDWSGRLVGPMALPRFEGLADRSPWYAEHDAQLTVPFRDDARLYLAVKNLLDFVQRDALVRPEDPFGDAFDTARVYGPLRGRRLLMGVRYGVSR